MRNPFLELAVIYAFFDRLNTFYQAWKDRYLGSYSKNKIDKNEKIIKSTMEEILKLLINRENGAKVSVVSESTIRALIVFQKSSKKQKKKWSLFKAEEKDYIYCLKNNYDSYLC